MNRFSPEVCSKLGFYVYRLVDPRDGMTFYVGKGQKNRVFDHAKMALKFSLSQSITGEDSISAKYEQIRSIIESGLEVICIIHRHHIKTAKEAFEIEGALIDAYQGLTNVQDGHGNSDFGCANAVEIQRRYGAEEAVVASGKYVIIKVREAVVNARGSIYEAVRRAWRINIEKAKGRMVLACVNGLIRGVFTNLEWREDAEHPGRYGFSGVSAEDDFSRRLIGQRLPGKYCKKGLASPILYS